MSTEAAVKVIAPPLLSATIKVHDGGRVIMIEFKNGGNTDAPRELQHAALITEGCAKPAAMELSQNCTWHVVPIDAELEQITLTIGQVTIDHEQQDALVAVMEMMSLEKGRINIPHFCARFD